MAMLCPLLSIFSLAGLIAALVIWLVKKDESPYVNYWGKAAVFWSIFVFAACMVSIPLVFIGIGVLLIWAIAIAHVVVSILATIKANSVQPFKYWFVADLICRAEYEAVFGASAEADEPAAGPPAGGADG